MTKIQAVQEMLNRLSQLTGGDSFAAVDGLPFDADRASMDIALMSIEGNPPTVPDGKLLSGLRLVSPGYFQTMRCGMNEMSKRLNELNGLHRYTSSRNHSRKSILI